MDIDAELRPRLDVVEVVHDEGNVEGVGEGLDMVGGGGGDGPEDPGHPGIEEITQGLASLETVITRVPGEDIIREQRDLYTIEYFSASEKEKQGRVLLNS